jgi:DNA-binding MarR family transcriptional regulator
MEEENNLKENNNENKLKYIIIPKYIEVLSLMFNMNQIRQADVYDHIKMTYAHFTKVIKIFKDLNWVNTEKRGRDIFIIPTELGKQIINSASGFYDLVSASIRTYKKYEKI